MFVVRNPFSLLRQFNHWREEILETGFNRFLAGYQARNPDGYTAFRLSWLSPRLVNLPNLISIFRMLAVMPLLYLLNLETAAGYWLSITVFGVISLTDLLDGPLARASQCKTVWGTNLDPLADRVLIIGVVIVQNQNFPIILSQQVTALIAGEILFTAMRFYRLINQIEPYGSNLLGKSKFVLQVLVALIMIIKAPQALLANFILLISLILLYCNILSGLWLIAKFHFSKAVHAAPPN